MAVLIDRTGQRFNHLTALSPTSRALSSGRKMPAWRLRCDCGNELVVLTVNLTKGKPRSCGCKRPAAREERRERRRAERQQRPVAPKRERLPAYSKMPEYRVHRQMIQRCYLPTAPNFRWYGEKGVTVCDRWRFGTNTLSGFEAFIEDMGRRPEGMTLDRIDPTLPYAPGNCRWATWAVQGMNRREHHMTPLERAAISRERSERMRGEAAVNAKLKEVQVARMKRLIAEGARTSDLAREFGVSPQTVSGIKHHGKWAHVRAERVA